MIKCANLAQLLLFMKKHLISSILILSAFSIQAEGVNLICSPYKAVCVNCPEYQTLFPLEKFINDPKGLDVEADKSEILTNDAYHFSGDVELTSESYFLSADDIKVFPTEKSTLAKGNVKFQDEQYLITSEVLSAKKEEGELIATASSANYQDISSGELGANGFAKTISKTQSSVFLTDTTYSLCPLNENDWLIDADSIELNLDKNRGIADNATLIFYGFPIFYLPKYGWVLEGRGSGFLTPDYSAYSEPSDDYRSHRFRIPYYFNIAPDRDLILALNYMSSRGFTYEGKYRQLIAPKITPDGEHSIWEIEAKYLFDDKMTGLQRWLLDTSIELDITEKTHLSAAYKRISDTDYFTEISRTGSESTLKSNLKLSFEDPDKSLKAHILTEHEQAVSAEPGYQRALETSISKTYRADKKSPIQVNLNSTKFVHETITKSSGVRTDGNFGITRTLSNKFPIINTRANARVTHYKLKNSNNITRHTIGTGVNFTFPFKFSGEWDGSEIYYTVSPSISHNYRTKILQGSIPIFDTTDKHDDIITFADLTSGERYTGPDRVTNANDITLSLQTTASNDNNVLLTTQTAQTYYTDDEVVSDKLNTNYETRRSYSDIAASVNLIMNNFIFDNDIQYDPDKSKIVKKKNSVSYKLSPKKFISLSYSDDGAEEITQVYGSFPINDSIHLFGGLDKTTSTGIINKETTGIAYESCCWSLRIAHFKEDGGGGDYSYNTGLEVVFPGLGSTASPLKGRIEGNIPYYQANLR